MISLHATKPLAAGEGAILLGDPDWIREVERWANFGFAGDRITRAAGMNGKLSEYHAAVALASLDRWEADRAQWQKTTRAVLDVSDRLGTRPQPALRDGWVTSTWICELPSEAVKVRLQRELAAAGIEFRDWWGAGIAAMPHFQSAPSDDLPVTADLAARTIGLPLFRDMETAEILDIAAVVAAMIGDVGEA